MADKIFFNFPISYQIVIYDWRTSYTLCERVYAGL